MAEKILIVDDDLDTLRLVGLMLERQGYQILAASSGTQALAMVKSEKPDLLLLDLMMPDMDGEEVARRLRADPETQNILIIMFTAKTQTDDKLTGYEVGADDYITKPAQPRELVAHVRAVLGRAKRMAATASPSRPVGPRGKLIGVIGAKGGTGVSTVAANLGVALCNKHRKSVVVTDFRPGCGSIGLELGMTNSQGFTRLLERKPTELSLQEIEGQLAAPLPGNIRFLLSSPYPRDAVYCTAVDSFVTIANLIPHLAQVTVVDLGVGITPVNEKVLPKCDAIILVVEPIAQTILQTKYLWDYLISKDFNADQIIPVLVNRVRAGVQLSLSQVQDNLEHQIAVTFTAAPELAYQANVENVPMIVKQGDGITAQQYNALADRIVKRVA